MSPKLTEINFSKSKCASRICSRERGIQVSGAPGSGDPAWGPLGRDSFIDQKTSSGDVSSLQDYYTAAKI